MSESEEQTVNQAKSAPSSSVGALLKATRTRMGQDLKQVSQALRIRQLFLQAIEDGRYEELPGPTYALGFVRSYSDFLGLDSEEVVRRFRAETSGSGLKNELVFPTPAAEKRLPSGALVAAALALCVVVYGGWYAISSSQRGTVESVPEVPDRLSGKAEEGGEEAKKDDAPPEPTAMTAPAQTSGAEQAAKQAEAEAAKKAEAEAAAKKTEAEAAARKAEAEAAAKKAEAEAEAKKNNEAATRKAELEAQAKKAEAETAAKKAEAEAAAKKVEPAKIEPGKQPAGITQAAPVAQPTAQGMGGLAVTGQQAPAKPGPAAPATPAQPQAAAPAPAAAVGDEARQNKTYGQAEGDVRVVIRATGDSWIQVRDEKGNLVATRLLKKGDSYRVPTNQGKLSLTTGDAGALSALVDGILVTPSLGPSGSVRRDIALEPDRIKAGN